MQKDRPVDWQDTNMSLFGSDIEKKCKAAAADSEPQWDDAGVKPGLQVWRIEQFRVKPWPKSKYGRFHAGDSYIILNTYVKEPDVNPDKLAWDVHFWIGSESTQDEYGTAAYKTVELDDKLDGAAIQHREVQEAESELFLGYFGGKLMYLSGGAASGFKSVEAESRPTRLFQVKGRANNMLLKEVKVRRDAMNSGDVFILDSEEGIWQWSGKESNAHERLGLGLGSRVGALGRVPNPNPNPNEGGKVEGREVRVREGRGSTLPPSLGLGLGLGA